MIISLIIVYVYDKIDIESKRISFYIIKSPKEII